MYASFRCANTMLIGGTNVDASPRRNRRIWMSALPVRPFPSSNGWIVSNWAWANAACTMGGRASSSAKRTRSPRRRVTSSGGGGTKAAPHGL